MWDGVADLSVSLTSGQLTLRSIFVSSDADSSSIVWEKLYSGPCNRGTTYQQTISLGKIYFIFVRFSCSMMTQNYTHWNLMHGPALVPNKLKLFYVEFLASWGCAVEWLILTPSEVLLLNDSYNPFPLEVVLLNNNSGLNLRLCC